MKQIKNFVKNTFKDVDKDKRNEIIQSVTISLTEKVEDLIETGLSEQEAIDKAVVEFGTVEDFFDDNIKKQKKEKRQKTLRHYGNDLLFSGVGSAIVIGLLAFINFYYNSSNLWFVVPSIAILFWPLAILYNLLNKRANKKEKKDE
ncbi:MAG: hypothetical protein KQ78_01745 [Candidatus Izimaplasma bacterium HR2]|nr:MAG: hypothetical protein KQ78_01745 [Candidatus Izimaplasma bacterium HR2]